MPRRNVVQIGDNILRNVSTAVEFPLSKEIREIIEDMIDTMRDTNLIGIAAPQIGIGKRIFVTEIRGTTYRNVKNIQTELIVFINPVIVSFGNSSDVGFEGCGSLCNAGLFGEVERPSSVTIEAYDLDGNKFNLEAEGLLGRCIQHEMDHLNGIICIDRFHNTKNLMSAEHYRNSKG